MYNQSITRRHRTAFILLIDQSGSMAEIIGFRGARIPKAEAVAAIANDLLFELMERARRSDGIRDYYDIALLGYSGGDSVCGILPDGREMASVTELESLRSRIVERTTEYTLPDGTVSRHAMVVPQWVVPHAEGQTPMCEALRRARDIAAEWVARPENAESFPPVIFNLTDGEATDCDPAELRLVAREIRELRTEDGAVLLMNIHFASSERMRPLIFPNEEEMEVADRLSTLLYEMSSEMPECFWQAIRTAKSAFLRPPFRGMSYNASMCEVVTMLNIGSISMKTE